MKNTAKSFETLTPTFDDFAQRIRQNIEFFPWLVMEIDGGNSNLTGLKSLKKLFITINEEVAQPEVTQSIR